MIYMTYCISSIVLILIATLLKKGGTIDKLDNQQFTPREVNNIGTLLILLFTFLETITSPTPTSSFGTWVFLIGLFLNLYHNNQSR